MSLYFETSYGSLHKYGEELCGDKVQITKTDEHIIMVLSDGLGSGVKANILASLTSKIASTMLEAGASINDVVETIASTLPVCKVRQLAYSTFTFLRINKKNGRAYIVEYDNPEMIILRDGFMLDLPRKEKIVSDKKIYETHMNLEPDDFCIFFSDGVIYAGKGEILNLNWQHNNVVDYLEAHYKKDMSAQMMQSLLLSVCANLYDKKPGDDTTVAVCKVRTPHIAYVMIGPPADKENDIKIVNELINFDGVKVVCGGTTSQIVSRVTGRKIASSNEVVNNEVPPIGFIQGIDLVTEGVVTLNKTVDIIRKFQAGTGDVQDFCEKKKDGATLLAEILVDKCTGARFIVGQRINEAHQQLDAKFDLNIKIKLINAIAECLREMDKEVSVEFH